jgi:protocatechuate 3,4-dioxygenase beta subunit
MASPTVEGLILEPGARRAFALQLAEGWTLSGRVVDARRGAPIADAAVHVAAGPLGAHSRQVQSDSEGRFTLRGIVGDDQSVYVEAEGYVPAGPLSASPARSELDVTLEPAATISGAVVDDRGRPIEGAIVRAYGADAAVGAAPPPNVGSLGVTEGPVPPISGLGARQLAFVEQVSSGARGGFTISHLQSGAYTLVATHEAYAPGESRSLEVGAGEVLTDVEIILRPGAELRGRVLDARRNPLAGIPVELRVSGERMPRMAATGEDGSFSFRGVRGDVEVTALPYDLQPTTRTLSIRDERRIDIELVLSNALTTLRGRVVDERGAGVEGALITVRSPGSRTAPERNAKSAEDGTFSVPALPEPPYDVEVEHPSYGAARLTQVEATEDVRVVLTAGVTLLGRVVDDWSGRPLRGVRVALEGAATSSENTTDDGSFRFPQTPIGLYQITFAHPDFEKQSQRIEVEPPLYVDRPLELETIRLVPGGTIEGEVRDAYGEPVPGAEVAWGDPPDWGDVALTNAQGRFRLRGIPAGSVWLTARHPEAGRGESSRPVLVRPKETSPGGYVRLPGRLDIAE